MEMFRSLEDRFYTLTERGATNVELCEFFHKQDLEKYKNLLSKLQELDKDFELIFSNFWSMVFSKGTSDFINKWGKPEAGWK